MEDMEYLHIQCWERETECEALTVPQILADDSNAPTAINSTSKSPVYGIFPLSFLNLHAFFIMSITYQYCNVHFKSQISQCIHLLGPTLLTHTANSRRPKGARSHWSELHSQEPAQVPSSTLYFPRPHGLPAPPREENSPRGRLVTATFPAALETTSPSKTCRQDQTLPSRPWPRAGEETGLLNSPLHPPSQRRGPNATNSTQAK